MATKGAVITVQVYYESYPIQAFFLCHFLKGQDVTISQKFWSWNRPLGL